MKVKVKANAGFENVKDAERSTKEKEVYFIEGDTWTTTKERAEYLQEKGAVEIIKEIKEVEELNVEFFTKGNNDKELVIPTNISDIIKKEIEKEIKPKKKKTTKKK